MVNFCTYYKTRRVRTLLAYSTYKGFKVYQMDVNFAFLNGVLEEEVYIEQHDGYVDPKKSGVVYTQSIIWFETSSQSLAWEVAQLPNKDWFWKGQWQQQFVSKNRKR